MRQGLAMGQSLVARAARLSRLPALFVALAIPAACSSSNNPPASSSAETSSERSDAVERLDRATALVRDFEMKVPDEVSRNVRCVVAIPSMVQGGLVFGGRGGRGFTACRKGASDWSVPAPVSVSGASFGAQVGVTSSDVMMLVMTENAKTALLGGHFRVGVDASAAAGTVGTEATSDFRLGSEVLTYARSQGLFAGATFSGATIARDDSATLALYGGMPELSSMLEGPMPMPGAAASRFVAACREAFGPGPRPAAVLRGTHRGSL
jgi:SH3 domain-containing YSC84-like protein 1